MLLFGNVSFLSGWIHILSKKVVEVVEVVKVVKVVKV